MSSLIPSRRRGKLASATKAARNVALVRAGLSLAETRLAKRLPGVRKRRTITPKRVVAVGGGVLAATAGVLAKRRSGGGGDGGSSTPSTPVPPTPTNYDASGPPANTATPRAYTPEPTLGIDEAAEEAAASAEAAAIGGTVGDYVGNDPSLSADDADRPLAEAGEGESEGLDQATAELLDNVTAPVGPGAGMTDAERRIQEAIAEQTSPQSGETPDARTPPSY